MIVVIMLLVLGAAAVLGVAGIAQRRRSLAGRQGRDLRSVFGLDVHGSGAPVRHCRGRYGAAGAEHDVGRSHPAFGLARMAAEPGGILARDQGSPFGAVSPQDIDDTNVEEDLPVNAPQSSEIDLLGRGMTRMTL